MDNIVEMRFGSHLYGTNTPSSDLDIKAVYIPSRADILLQWVKPVITRNTKVDKAAKNSENDTDFEAYSLQKFLHLVSEGSTVALDMLFANESAFLKQPDWLWREIQENTDKLITRRCTAFVGYCRQQANKYGIKGSRMAAARVIVEWLESALAEFGTTAKLELIYRKLDQLAEGHEHIAIEEIPSANGNAIKHLVVCNRKAPYTATIKFAYGVYKALFDEYGQRSLAAERNEGVDWKALSHAVRVGNQAVELLETGRITFPRPEAAHLVNIKTGKLLYADVASEIETLLVEVESVALKSKLPDEPDKTWIDGFVLDAYAEVVDQ